MARNDIIVKDRGWDDIVKGLGESVKVEGVSAGVGIQGVKAVAASKEHKGKTNVYIGLVHEFGTRDGRIPSRSYLRSTFDEREKEYQKEIDEAARRVSAGKADPRGEMLVLGELHRGHIIAKIKDSIPPPLAESTIAAKKKETTPLIDTGQLFNSISVDVSSDRKLKK